MKKQVMTKLFPVAILSLVENVSVQRLKANGADAVKVLLYIDIDEDRESMTSKKPLLSE